MRESRPPQTDVQTEEIISMIQKYSELVVEEEVEYVRRRMKMDDDSTKDFYNCLLSFSARLLAPITGSLKDWGASQLSILELIGRAIDEHLLIIDRGGSVNCEVIAR